MSFKNFFHPYKPYSINSILRRRRFDLFKSLFASLSRPIKILDVGGTQTFWERMGWSEEPGIEIVILNLQRIEITYPNMQYVFGDARDMKQFRDNEFDIVFSNSVIEHITDYDGQRLMAEEVMRVGKNLFLQTPNIFFPIEPHFLFPYFQFLPLNAKVWMVSHLNVGWYKKEPQKHKAIDICKSIRLLSKKELIKLFPDSDIYTERFLGMPKSFMVCCRSDSPQIS